jgi:hypothetical protein
MKPMTWNDPDLFDCGYTMRAEEEGYRIDLYRLHRVFVAGRFSGFEYVDLGEFKTLEEAKACCVEHADRMLPERDEEVNRGPFGDNRRPGESDDEYRRRVFGEILFD